MLPLDIYITEKTSDPAYASSFISIEPKLRIPRGDLDRLREHFTEIAQGKVLVE